MTTRDRVAEIQEIKLRGQREATALYYDLRNLLERWTARDQGNDDGTDFYPIRAVTLLEVFTRTWIAQLVDHGSPYVDRALALAKNNLKFDYDLVRAVHGKNITLGDLVAHSVPVNSFSQIVGTFEVLTEQPHVNFISQSADRWETEIRGLPPTPIVKDKDAMAASLSRLFEVRHILCHEFPRKKVYEREEISLFLAHAEQFAHATTAAFSELLYGKYPLTNAEMKESAAEVYKNVDRELEHVIAELKARADETNRHLLDEAQKSWALFREQQCAFRADLARGGTLSGLLWLLEATTLTESRLKQLRWYLEKEEYDV